jgi:hypothetical protein
MTQSAGWCRSRLRAVTLAGLFMLASACGSDEPGAAVNGAGSAGAGGTMVLPPAGSGGAAGMNVAGSSAGVSGSAGRVGASAAGVGGGSAGSAGNAGSAGSVAGSGGAGSSGAGAGGSAGGGGSGGDPQCEGEGATEHFSFFVTSLAGLRRLSGSENGFGGDLRFGKSDGLSGADEICRQLAETSYPGAGCKTWRAFLSVTNGPQGGPVHAGQRIGEGPWYDRLGRLVAMTKADLLEDWPVGADPIIMEDLPNEDGVPNQNPDGTGNVDNHNTVTGTAPGGMLFSMNPEFTCRDWTSKVGTDGTPMIGFSWRGGAGGIPGSSWYSNTMMITEGGCAPIINLEYEMDFEARGIGSRGGYGGFYCLALEP